MNGTIERALEKMKLRLANLYIEKKKVQNDVVECMKTEYHIVGLKEAMEILVKTYSIDIQNMCEEMFDADRYKQDWECVK